MSSYHSSFSYLNENSKTKKWIISHFEADDGEQDSYLSQDQVYTDSYNGAKRNLYGTRWNAVANVKITVIKQDGGDFTFDECREASKWLTGNPEASWLELYVGDEMKSRLLCTIQDVKPQKLDARIIGLNIYCESLSPWAYSPLQTYEIKNMKTGEGITIDNKSDDLYSFVYPKITYTNSDATDVELTIHNYATGDVTIVQGLLPDEKITLDSKQMITSSVDKKFGNSFNYVWPRLKAGENYFEIDTSGNPGASITFEYYYPIKMSECCHDINVVSDPICNDAGEIQVDTLPWARVSDTPDTLSGYGITDTYTKTEVDDLVATVDNRELFINAGVFNNMDEIKSYKFIVSNPFANQMYIFKIGQAIDNIPVGTYAGRQTYDPVIDCYVLEFSSLIYDGIKHTINLDSGVYSRMDTYATARDSVQLADQTTGEIYKLSIVNGQIATEKM